MLKAHRVVVFVEQLDDIVHFHAVFVIFHASLSFPDGRVRHANRLFGNRVRPSSRIQEGLEDVCGGQLIDHQLALVAASIAFNERLVRLRCGKPLVLEAHLPAARRQKLRKIQNRLRLRADFAGQRAGEADDQPVGFVLTEDFGDALHVVRPAAREDRFNALRGQPERIGHRHADASFAHVQRHDALCQAHGFSSFCT